MLRKERHEKILDIIKSDGIIKVSDMMKVLSISDMTARRDLTALEEQGFLIRVHGGAQRTYTKEETYEKTHSQKQELQVEEKKQIARKAAGVIKDGETIFIGPGTTLEHLASELESRKIRVITNSLPVFSILKNSQTVDLLLIGGEYREITGAFVGSMTIHNLKTLRFSKSFVGANAVSNNSIATYSEAEGEIQRLALEGAVEKFLLVDSSKFDKYDFFNFYHLNQIDKLVTDSNVTDNQIQKLNKMTHLIL